MHQYLYNIQSLYDSSTAAFYAPVENGTYYGMVMSVRFSVRPSVRHTLDNREVEISNVYGYVYV
jgi:hypothetical protein